MKLNFFEDLECWIKARELVKMVYEITENERFKKDFRLCSQIQAAATSTMANKAEGFVRRSNKEFIQFLFISISSVAEVQSHLYVAMDQRYIDEHKFREVYDHIEETSQIISGLIKYLRKNLSNLPKQTK